MRILGWKLGGVVSVKGAGLKGGGVAKATPTLFCLGFILGAKKGILGP